MCVNTFTWHSLSFVIFYENKLDLRLFFDETALEFKKKKCFKHLECEGENSL